MPPPPRFPFTLAHIQPRVALLRCSCFFDNLFHHYPEPHTTEMTDHSSTARSKLATQCGRHCCWPWQGLVQSVKEGQLLQVRSGWRVMGRKGQRGTEKDMLPSLLFSILISSLLIEPSPAPLNSSKGSHGTVERSGTFHRRRVFELCFWNCQSWSIYKGGWESSLPRVSVRSKWRLQRCASLCSSFLSSLWTHSFFTSSSLPRLSPLCLPSQDILITTHPGDADAYIFRCHELLKH